MGIEPVSDWRAGAKASPEDGYLSIMGGSRLEWGWTVLALVKESCDS